MKALTPTSIHPPHGPPLFPVAQRIEADGELVVEWRTAEELARAQMAGAPQAHRPQAHFGAGVLNLHGLMMQAMMGAR